MVGCVRPARAARRRLAYEKAGLPPPAAWPQGRRPALPTTITLMLPAGPEWPSIHNHRELLAMLRRVAGAHGLRVGGGDDIAMW